MNPAEVEFLDRGWHPKEITKSSSPVPTSPSPSESLGPSPSTSESYSVSPSESDGYSESCSNCKFINTANSLDGYGLCMKYGLEGRDIYQTCYTYSGWEPQ